MQMLVEIYDIWPTLRHVHNMSTTFPTKLKKLLKAEWHKVKPSIINCKKYSTTLLHSSIKNEFTQCSFKNNFVINNHVKTVDDCRAQNVSAEWYQFHLLDFLSHSTPSFLFDDEDFLESWWNLIISFENPSAFTVRKSESYVENTFKIDHQKDIILVNVKKVHNCPVLFISCFM